MMSLRSLLCQSLWGMPSILNGSSTRQGLLIIVKAGYEITSSYKLLPLFRSYGGLRDLGGGRKLLPRNLGHSVEV